MCNMYIRATVALLRPKVLINNKWLLWETGKATCSYRVNAIVSDLTCINIHTTEAKFLPVLISRNYSPCD